MAPPASADGVMRPDNNGRMKKLTYQRKTYDEWQVHGLYPPHGWEEVTAAASYTEGHGFLQDYRDNEPGTRFKLICRRLPVAALATA